MTVRKLNSLRIYIVLILVCFNSGLVLAQSTEPDIEKKELKQELVFGNAEGMEKVAYKHFFTLFRKEAGAMKDYTKFMIDPVLIYIKVDQPQVAVNPKELAELADYFKAQIVKQFHKSKLLQITDKPGPGVARFTIAITGVKPSKSGVNAVTKVVGIATGVGMLVPSVSIGNASIEVVIQDSTSGENLIILADNKKGRRMFNVKGIKKWGDAKSAFKKWAKEFRKSLEIVQKKF